MGPPYMVVGYVGSPASATVKRHPPGGGNPTLSTGKTCLGCDLC
ncbi:hypothetical protein HanXRQr2_Chr11g0506831 [Helianthus annuus]|uniref:Uncharacterized protein n=1 Tax=Helianthus annuus TaxID=4232 RepID=A0A9K3HRT6_HELAN|nr:hypothetical protein HanXRQr2_Chr11g0506831 [Helianthus annuus]KAJ0876436.1 hypothetical protein HanPSC8_Chr11g0488451 [Helianthus annuus]